MLRKSVLTALLILVASVVGFLLSPPMRLRAAPQTEEVQKQVEEELRKARAAQREAEAARKEAEAQARRARAAAAAAVADKPAPYVHTVIFYLKKDAPAGTTEALVADCHRVLAKIKSVRGVWAGKPADKATPKFAVMDYQVGLLVLFDNADGLQTYLEDPLHEEFVKKHGQHLDKVLVYDFMSQK